MRFRGPEGFYFPQQAKDLKDPCKEGALGVTWGEELLGHIGTTEGVLIGESRGIRFRALLSPSLSINLLKKDKNHYNYCPYKKAFFVKDEKG